MIKYYILRIFWISQEILCSIQFIPQSDRLIPGLCRLDLPRIELMIRGGCGGGMKAWERSSEWGPGCDPLLFLGAPPRWDKISEPFTGAIILMMCFTPSPDPLLSLYISIHGLGAIGVSRGNGYPLICHTTQPAVYNKQIWCLIISKCNRVFCNLVSHSLSDHSAVSIS